MRLSLQTNRQIWSEYGADSQFGERRWIECVSTLLELYGLIISKLQAENQLRT